MKKILLLEDDKNLNHGITLKLQKEGYEVSSAFSLKEAEELFVPGRIDLVICDVNLLTGAVWISAPESAKKQCIYFVPHCA